MAMTTVIRTRMAVSIGLALWCAGAAADPDAPVTPGAAASDGEIIYVQGARPRQGIDALDSDDAAAADAARALDEPAFVTIVHVSDREGETTSVAEVLAESVGVSTRSLGGLGSFASISVRGASPGHTAMSIDGVPLSRIAAAAADLGGFELASFSEVEVYRGGVPVALGGAALGGAVNFVTATRPDASGHTMRVSAGAGSYGARHVRGRWRDALFDGRLGVHASAGYRGADGDFAYFNDNGTSLNPDDDSYPTRTNNDFDQGDAVLRARWRDGAFTIEGGARTLVRDQGLPGVASVQTEAARLSSWSQLVDARASRRAGRALLGGSLFALFEREQLDDEMGEVGLGADQRRSDTMSVGASATAAWAVGARHRLLTGVEGLVESLASESPMNEEASTRNGRRLAAAASAAGEVAVAGDRVILVPAVRVDALRSDPGTGWDPILVDPSELAVRREWYASPRLAVRARVTDSFVIKSSAGRYFRAPTLTEAYGDRGFLVGNPALAAETGTSADAGAVLAPATATGPFDRIYLHAAAFGSRPNDAIAFVPTAGRSALAKNVGDANIVGAESAVTFRLWRRATIAANYTLIDSEVVSPTPSYDGKRLPLRPRHQLYGRADIAQRALGTLVVVWGEASFTSGNYLDAANTSEVPSRRLFGAGVKLSPVPDVVLAFEAKNLTDERVETIDLDPAPRPDLASVPRAVSDVLGYPLPGRSFYLSMDWSFL